MTNNGTNGSGHRGAWGAVAALMVLLSSLSLAAPSAFAQQADQKTRDSGRYLQVLESVYQFVLKNYVDEVDPKVLYDGAMKGMFEALGDPYSVFLDEPMMSDMTDVTEGKFGGVGLYISKQLRDPRKPEDTPLFIEVVSPIEDTPAWRAGFKPGDLILEIGGESSAPLSTDEAQSRIRGTPGSPVTFTVRRAGGVELELTVTRAIIEIPTVKKALIPLPDRAGAPVRPIAYLRIVDFTPQTLPRVQDALREFDRAGYSSMIVDVRSNPGGLLRSVIDIADLFLDKGVIVSTKGRNPAENEVSRAKPDLAVPPERRVVVLIDRGSASASEILAAALKDNKRAYLVGENSYGKGSVQQIYPIDGTGFKLTMARYYAPSDENIDKTGIAPDLESREAALTDAQGAELERLYASGEIVAFAEGNPKAGPAERDAFAARLGQTYKLPERLLRRLVRDELARSSVAPTYDLEFDTALVAAIEVLGRPDYPTLLAEARSVREIVAAKKAAAGPAK